jgi:small-conductance mechanosensitive channel
LLFAGVFGLLLARRHRAIEFAAEDTAFAATAHIFRRPFSAAALVALLAVYWVYAPGVPRAVVSLVGLAALLPSLRLLPGLLGEASRSTIWGLALLYLLDRLQDLVSEIPLLSRLLLLVVTSAALLLGAWLLRSGRIAELRPDARWLRAFTLGSRIGVALLGIALGANLFGFVDLAALLANGVLVAAYGGVVTYAVARTVDGVVAVALHMKGAQRLQTVRRHAPLLTRRARGVIRVLALAVWGVIVLSTFHLRDAVRSGAGVLFGTPVTLGELAISLGDVVGVAAAITAAWLLSRFVRFVLDEEVYPRALLRRGVPQAISTTLHYVILLAGFALALGAAGVNLDRFTVLVGAFGVGVGFGLQNVINNFVSGLILLFERPVQIGDTIEVGTLLGEVKRIGIRSSSVRTWEGADVIVPNAMLVSDRVVNWTYADRQRRIDLPVGVAYGSKPQQVAELLAQVARQHPRVLQDPEPVALFMGFGESSLDFELRVWTADFERFPRTRSELALAVHDALEQAGVEIPFPQRDLHLRSAEPAARAALPGPPGGPR